MNKNLEVLKRKVEGRCFADYKDSLNYKTADIYRIHSVNSENKNNPNVFLVTLDKLSVIEGRANGIRQLDLKERIEQEVIIEFFEKKQEVTQNFFTDYLSTIENAIREFENAKKKYQSTNALILKDIEGRMNPIPVMRH